MDSDDEGADVWGDLCKYLETNDPVDYYEIRGLWKAASKLPRIGSRLDVSRDVRFFSRNSVALDSEDIKGWWSKVQASSSLITRTPLDSGEWQYLMDILTHADVGRIEHLLLEFHDDVALACDQVWTALSRCGFCQLKTLMVERNRYSSSESVFLAHALRGPGLINLRTLWVRQYSTMLNALADESCKISQLTSFLVWSENRHDLSTLDTVFKIGRFKSLKWLTFYDTFEDDVVSWKEVFIRAIKSQNLPRLVRLKTPLDLNSSFLADLFLASREWFLSLESLLISGSGLTSEQVCSLVDALMEDPKTLPLALTDLKFERTRIDQRGVLALVRLADSHRLEQLQRLNLSSNTGNGISNSLLTVVQSIGKGGFPNLRTLNWTSASLEEADAETVVQAYYKDQSLTTEIAGLSWDGYADPSLKTKFKTYRDRNLRLAALRGKFVDDFGDFVPLISAKVFLCGFPEVGKTTLRRALRRSPGRKTTLKENSPKYFKKLFQQPRTRGIEISRIEAEKDSGYNTTLVVWDLAGQQEYHVLHGTFLPDIGFVGGKATTFILVFRATDLKEHGWTGVGKKLGYWLRFVASSSGGFVKRHVVVVLNRVGNEAYAKEYEKRWEGLIEEFVTKFSDVLDIRRDPFTSDVSRAASVQELKQHLFKHAEARLEGVGVPRVCMELHQELKAWLESEKNNQRQILTWAAFEEMSELKRKRGNRFYLNALEIAAAYLHEMGEIIYFKEESGDKSILIPNPEWFCRNVVGELLLPKSMLSEGGSSKDVKDNGSVPLSMFKGFFKDFLSGGIESNDVISLLERVGLCYRTGEEEIIVPALSHDMDYKSINWERKGFQWVMGRCLVVKDKEKNIVPVTLFRRLQVALAQDSGYGGREDSDYKVGKSYVNLRYGELLVLVQFDVDDSDPTDDRVDILVQSAMPDDPADVSSAQLQCVCDIMQKLEDLCVVCCDGLRYDIKVIQPSSAADWTHKMSQRKLMSLQTVKDLLVKGKQYLGWQVGGHNVKTESVLSKAEIERLVGNADREYDACRQDAISMGLLPKDFLQETEAVEEKCSYTAFMGEVLSDGNDEQHLMTKAFYDGLQQLEARLRAIVHEDGQRTRKHIDTRSTELLLECRRGHHLLIKHILAQQSFSSAAKGESVPRYMYLLKKQEQSFVDKVTGAFRYTYEMHFLCESHFDHGFVHQVKEQEGIELTETKQWLVKVSPWLRRSLQVALIVGKVVGNIYLPGVFNLIPDISVPSSSQGSATVVERALKMLLDEHKEINQSLDDDGNCGTPGEAIKVDERRIAQGVVTQLIKDLGDHEFAQKTGLRAGVLRATDAGSSDQAQSSVAWICDDCWRAYRSNKGHAHLM